MANPSQKLQRFFGAFGRLISKGWTVSYETFSKMSRLDDKEQDTRNYYDDTTSSQSDNSLGDEDDTDSLSSTNDGSTSIGENSSSRFRSLAAEWPISKNKYLSPQKRSIVQPEPSTQQADPMQKIDIPITHQVGLNLPGVFGIIDPIDAPTTTDDESVNLLELVTSNPHDLATNPEEATISEGLSLEHFIDEIRKSKGYIAFIAESAKKLPGGPITQKQEEELIIADSGVPPEAMRAMMDVNEKVQGMTTVRQGTAPLTDKRSQAKPLLVHSKCGNRPLGILSGLICTNPLLSKINAGSTDRAKDVAKARNAIKQDLADAQERIKPLQLKLTLRDILSKTSLPPSTDESMVIDRIDNEDGQEFLVLKYNKKEGFGPPDCDDVEFRIQLNQLSESNIQPLHEEGSNFQELNKSIIQALSVSSSQVDCGAARIAAIKGLTAFIQGNQNYLDTEFAIDYRTSPEEGYNPLEVLGMNGQKITGDVDLDYYAIPMGLPSKAYEAINTLDGIKEKFALLKNTEALFLSSRDDKDSPLNELYKKLNEAYKDLQKKSNPNKKPEELIGLNDFFKKDPTMMNYFASLSGIIAPVEFLQNIAINILHNVEHIDINNPDSMLSLYNPIQHGVEHRSPHIGNADISSGTDGKRLHIIYDKNKNPPGNRVFYTFTDEQRAKLCLTEGFLEKNFVYVNPKANMQYWGAVVKRQLELQDEFKEGMGPRVDPKTRKAYENYTEEQAALSKQTERIERRKP